MIKVENLKKTFRVAAINPLRKAVEVEALRGAGFEVGQGEIVALVGRNGAGKSTLLKILGMTLLHDSGSAEICGQDVSAGRSETKRCVGIVNCEERSMYWRLTGRQNLTLYGALYDIPRSELPGRIDAVMSDLGMSAYADRPARSYSAGMKQRLSIARGLIHRPKVVLMDEPTKSADPALQAKFAELVREEVAGRQQCAALFATHNMEEALALGGRVLVVEKGRIVYDGRPDRPEELKSMIAGFEAQSLRDGGLDL